MYYLNDFDDGKLESVMKFSSHGAVESSDKPLKDLVVGDEFIVVVFCDKMTLYHQCETRDHLLYSDIQFHDSFSRSYCII